MCVTRPDNRRLPLYEAGQIDVPFVIAGHSELIDRDTQWEVHSHPTHELLWNESGTSRATVGPHVYAITPSMGLWIPAGVAHSGWSPGGTRQRASHFRIGSVPAISADAASVEITPLLRLLLDRIDSVELERDSRRAAETMVLDVLRPASRELLLRMPQARILQPIVSAIRDDPTDTTTLVEWSTRLGVSSRTITRQFTLETGMGFARWIAAARMQHAIAILGEGSEIDEVATRTGYRSASAFSTAFRRVTGMTPGRFRAQ
jgi:AraC-like DNA-binding protein